MTQNSVPQNQCPLKPLSGYIVITPLEMQTTKSEGKGSFHVADEGKKMESAGVVQAIGDKYPHPAVPGIFVEPEVEVGNKVVFKRFGYEPYKHINGQEYYHIRFTDIVSIIDEQ